MSRRNTVVRSFFLLVAFCCFVARPPLAHAGYIDNRSQWLSLSSAAREAYVMGTYDGMNRIFSDEPDSTLAGVQHRNACMRRLSIQPSDLTRMIDEGYARDAAAWSYPPYAMILRGLIAACGPPPE